MAAARPSNFFGVGTGETFSAFPGGILFQETPSTQGSMLALVLPLVVKFKHIPPSRLLLPLCLIDYLPSHPRCGHQHAQSQARFLSLPGLLLCQQPFGFFFFFLLLLPECSAVALSLKAGMRAFCKYSLVSSSWIAWWDMSAVTVFLCWYTCWW